MQLLVGLPPRSVMNSRPFLASLLCASLASLAIPGAAHAQLTPAGLSASGQLAAALTLDAKPVNTSVLGLRSDDSKNGEALTSALRTAFAEREMSGGQELTLEEVVLTLDCSSEQDTACMTEAGRALETERLVYGTLTKAGGGYTLDISVLDVTSGQIEAQATMPLEGSALASGNVAATATDVVNSLYPQADSSPLPPTPVSERPKAGDPPLAQVDDESTSGLVWGAYKPRPKWKKVGLGVSATFAVLGAATAVTSWVLLKGKYEDEVTTAMDRVGDAQNGETTLDYCQRTQPIDKETPKMVVDPGRAKSCQNLLGARNLNIAGAAVAVAAGVSTVVFTVLHFVHRDESPKASARRHGFQLSGGLTPGGAMLGGSGRF